MSTNPLRNIRYKPAFRQWLADGQQVTPAVEAAAKRTAQTIYGWIKRERWHEAADELNAEALRIMAEETAKRELDLQAAKDLHQRETVEQVAELRAMLRSLIVGIRARQVVGADIDAGEVREATAAAVNMAKAAQALGFNWENPAKLDVTLEELGPADLDMIKQANMTLAQTIHDKRTSGEASA